MRPLALSQRVVGVLRRLAPARALAFAVVGALAAQHSQWTLVAAGNQPPLRSGHRLVFDAARQEVVLFGGFDDTNHLSDTWVWNGSTWTQRMPTYVPLARQLHAMAYDAARQRVVLFGGSAAASGTTAYLGDTYEWDGANWVPRPSVTFPPPRRESAMAYDATRQRCVLFGGALSGGTVTAQTWEWEGANWAQVATAGFSPPSQIVWANSTPFGPRVAGLTGFGANGMRAFDGAAWAAWSPTAVSLSSFQLAFDGVRDQFVAVGRQGSTPATAVCVGTPHAATLVGAGCGNPPLQFTPQPNGAPILGATARALISNAPTPVFAVTAGFNTTTIGQFPLPLPLDGFGMTGCVLRHSADILGLPVSPVAGSLEFALPIPNQIALLGQFVRLQAYGYAPGQNLAEIIVSNRLDWRIGDV